MLHSRSHRWVTLPDPVADDLHFDVPRARHQLLHVDAGVAKRSARLGLAALVCVADLVASMHDAHPAAAAACDRLDNHRSAIQRREKLPRVIEAGRRRGAR
jgi:hypothetical protein